MSATHLESVPDTAPADGLVARLDELIVELAGAVADCTPVGDAVRIDRIARLEKLRAVTAALPSWQRRCGRAIPRAAAQSARERASSGR